MSLIAPNIWVDSENLYIQDTNDMVEYFSVLVDGADGWEVSTQYKEDEVTTVPIANLWLMGKESYTLAVKSVFLGEVSEASNEVVWNEDGTYNNGDDGGDDNGGTEAKTPYDSGLDGYWVDGELKDNYVGLPVADGFPSTIYLSNGMVLELNNASTGQYLYTDQNEKQYFYQLIYWDYPEYYTFLVGQAADHQPSTFFIRFYLNGELHGSMVHQESIVRTLNDAQATIVTSDNRKVSVSIKYGSRTITETYDYRVPIETVSTTLEYLAEGYDYVNNATTYFSGSAIISVYAQGQGIAEYSFKRYTQDSVTLGYSDSETSNSFHFKRYKKESVNHGYSGPTIPTDCIMFMANTGNFTLTATNVEWDGTVEYSTDKSTWSTWDGTAISSVEQKLYLRGYDNTTFYSSNGVRFSLSGLAGCYGNINTLLQYDNPPTTLTSNCYRSMFRNCTSLAHAPDLPATTLAEYCYNSMFFGCTNLTQAPELPATTLAKYCYNSMFSGCKSLTQAPDLPATTLAKYCYYNMFYNCSNLIKAPELPATTLADYCYGYMFYNCINLIQALKLSATTLASYCCYGMFTNCTSLTQAPELPATTLAASCYQYMFYNCSNLLQAPALPATTLAASCYYYMFFGCTNLTQAPALPATTLASHCYYCMFYGCTSLTQAPELPATTLADYCYCEMFSGCTSLKLSATQTDEYTQAYRIPTSGAGTTASYALDDMFIYTGGTFVRTPEINTVYYLHNSCSIV